MLQGTEALPELIFSSEQVIGEGSVGTIPEKSFSGPGAPWGRTPDKGCRIRLHLRIWSDTIKMKNPGVL